MEFPLSKSAGADVAIHQADEGDIRLVTIPQIASPRPQSRFAKPLVWTPATPASVRDFSAVCWYMARELRRTRNTPFGLINASFGGSRIQAWLSPKALANGGGDASDIGLLALYNRDPAAANLTWGTRWQDWWRNTVSATSSPWLNGDVDGWSRVPLLDYWEKWPNPVLADFNGMVWYRTRVTLTGEQARQAASLDVGAVDEIDQTWVNGRPVGTGNQDEPRTYPIPAGTLHPGENVITVNILDTWETGGFFGPAERRAITFADGSRMPLSNPWFWRKVNVARPRPPRAPWYPAWGQGTLYNGMIAPLGDYAIKAMAWYQGESNDVDGAGYQRRLQALFEDRRATFGRNLPILVVQIANYGKINDAPVESQWAEVREAQRRQVVADRRSGLAVTIDVGNPANIHPTNKQTVGERLARAALAVVYGHNIPRAGPQPLPARRRGDQVVIRFRDVTGTLQVAQDEASFEACGPSDRSCRFVPAHVAARSVTVSVRPDDTRLRYCWGDSPRCTVRDRAVPLSPFESTIS